MYKQHSSHSTWMDLTPQSMLLTISRRRSRVPPRKQYKKKTGLRATGAEWDLLVIKDVEWESKTKERSRRSKREMLGVKKQLDKIGQSLVGQPHPQSMPNRSWVPSGRTHYSSALFSPQK